MKKNLAKRYFINFPGGEGGIRTLEGCDTLPAFQASALDQLCDLSNNKRPVIYTLFLIFKNILSHGELFNAHDTPYCF